MTGQPTHSLRSRAAALLGWTPLRWSIKGREAIAAGDDHDMDDVLVEIEQIVRGKVA